MINFQKVPAPQLGVAKRRDDWDSLTSISSIGRASLQAIPNYRLIKAATCAQASPQSRLLLVHLIGYLPVDKVDDPKSRFVVFPGNERLADELSYSKRSIQRLADELEEKGLLRRCYNGVNRRIGFDLTPLAIQHEEIQAGLVAIQTQRKASRERNQMELSLSADKISRPNFVPELSSQGAGSDIHNRTTNQSSAVERIATVLDAVSDDLKRNLCGLGDAEKDRTGDSAALKEALILKLLTGSGRAAHLGWTQAKRTFGLERALALVTIAEEDPRRRASTDRYFGWLLRMALTGDGHTIIEQVATRVALKAAEGANPVASPISPQQPDPSAASSVGGTPTGAKFLGLAAVSASVEPQHLAAPDDLQAVPGEDRSMLGWRRVIRREIGKCAYDLWMGRLRMKLSGNVVTITADSPFVARHIEDQYGDTIKFAIQSAANSQVLQVEYQLA